MQSGKVNFLFLMKEVRALRKRGEITQSGLADISNVAISCVKKFETGRGNIGVDYLVKILSALGMLDDRTVTFPSSDDAYCTLLKHNGAPIINDEVVVFSAKVYRGASSLGKTYEKITFTISKAALREYYCREIENLASAYSLLKIYNDNKEDIEYVAFRKYLEGDPDPNGWYNIRLEDVQ